MSISTLSAHSPKFGSKLVTLDHLRTLPEPVALGSRHKPVPHAVLIDALLAEVERRGFTAVRSQLALGAKGAALFGVLDLQPTTLVPGQDRGIAFGFRSSTNETLAIKAVAGTRVFVCDNLAMAGDMIAFLRRSTTGMDLRDVIATGFDKFLEQSHLLDLHVELMSLTPMSDIAAKELIFDIFYNAVLPARLFEDVARFYFKPTDEMTDCQPRTRWGLHNAFTRAMRDLPPVRLVGATVALGHAFGMSDDGLDIVDAD